jgi:hypothetical protein
MKPTSKSAAKPAKGGDAVEQPRRGTLRDLHLLKIYDHLPPSATLPVSVAAMLKGVDEKTIRRNYPTTPVSDGRVGVRKEHLEAVRTRGVA